MNPFDIALLVLMGLLVVAGLVKGMVRIMIGLLALVTAFFVASRYHAPVADRFGVADASPEASMLVTYVLLFIGVLLAGSVVAWLLRKVLKAAMLGWADRLAGAAVGLVAALLTAALLVLPVVAYSPWGSGTLRGSVLAPYVAAVADLAVQAAPDDLAQRYRAGVESLRDAWHGVTALPDATESGAI